MHNTYNITIRTKSGDELVLTQKVRYAKRVDKQLERLTNEWVDMLRQSGFTYLCVRREGWHLTNRPLSVTNRSTLCL